MNILLHGLFFQVIVLIVRFQHDSTLCSAGEPGYLDFDNLPETNFSCQGKVIGGYYADVEAGCQMFHVCTIGQKDEIMDIKFLCLNGTVFDQETRVCERVDEVDCSKSERFYNLNLELYGNNAVTLGLHDSNADGEDVSTEVIDDTHELQRTTSSRPSTTSATTSTTQRPALSSTTSASGSYQHPNGYPHHYQPQPRFPSVQTSQSTSLYDDKNGGYHHQYIYHTGDHRTNNLDSNGRNNDNQNRHSGIVNNGNDNNNNKNNNNNNNNQATSYQLFSNQGVSLTTTSPQLNQIRYNPTSGPLIQIRNDHQPTLSPIFHATSSTIQTLLNSNANSPSLINSLFHGIPSTPEHFAARHNPRETDEYHNLEDENENQGEESPEVSQSSAQDKSLNISPINGREESVRTKPRDNQGSVSTDQQRMTSAFLSTNNEPQVRTFYPTPRTSTKSSSSHVTQHIHVPPPPSIPLLKPHQIAINLSPPDIQRIIQNPSPLLPSQSRVIVTAKASVSDESGRPLNSTQLVTLPLPTIPASYDDYKEGDESFDPFYRDVPKIRSRRSDRCFSERETRIRTIRRKRDTIIDKIETINEADEKESETIADIEKSEVKAGIEGITESNHHSSPFNDTSNGDSVEHQFPSDSEELLDDKDSKETESREVGLEISDKSSNIVNADTESPNSTEDAEADTQDSSDSLDRNDFENDDKRSGNRTSNFRNTDTLNDESSHFPLALPEVIDPNETKNKYSSKNHLPEVNVHREWEEVTDALESMDGEEKSQVSGEEYSYHDYYYDWEPDTPSEGSVESSKEANNKIDSPRDKEPSDPNSEEKLDKDGSKESMSRSYHHYDSSEVPTTRTNKDVDSSETSDEYVDPENIHNEDTLEEDKDTSEFHDYPKTSKEIDSTEHPEATSSTEGILSLQDSKELEESDGVLKFTDEIPTTEEIDSPDEANKSFASVDVSQDYIDDNYEPQSYKEKEEYSLSTENGVTDIFHESTTIKVDKKNEKAELSMIPITATTDLPEKGDKNEEKQNDGPEMIRDKNISEDDQTDKSRLIKLEESTIASSTTTFTSSVPTTTIPPVTTPIPETTLSKSTSTSSLTTPPSATSTTTPLPAVSTTTQSSTISTATTLTTTSAVESAISTTSAIPTSTTSRSTTSSTTTSRPTPPKLFKPFTLRKSYVYVPPSTTPVPVIIKPRGSLVNPKPAKPPKSYNDYAPKPVIRKTILARKFPPTLRTTTPPPTIIFQASTETVITERTSSVPTETPASSSTNIPQTRVTEATTTLKNEKKEEIETLPTFDSQLFMPYPLVKMIEASPVAKKDLTNETEVAQEEMTTRMSSVGINNVPNVSEMAVGYLTPATLTDITSTKSSIQQTPVSSREDQPAETQRIETTSNSIVLKNDLSIDRPKSVIPISSNGGKTRSEFTTEQSISSTTLNDHPPILGSPHEATRKTDAVKRIAPFNCLEKSMYRFYADRRDCRLFHYCSPGFTPRQVLDFRFVCEEGTAFDEKSQSCVQDIGDTKCHKRVW